MSNDNSWRTEARTNKLENVLRKRQMDLTVVFENVHDPHNISACFRSCDAIGIYRAYLLYHSGQTFPKLGEKSSASARKWVEKSKFSNVHDCFQDLRSCGYRIYTTHMSSDAISIYDVDFTKPSAIVLGNEHSGVTSEALNLADSNILIPQVGMIQSLNISVACAVILYEAYRQRHIAGLYDNLNYPESEYYNNLNDWLKK